MFLACSRRLAELMSNKRLRYSALRPVLIVGI